MSEPITITRALVELKTLDKRINRELENTFVSYKVNSQNIRSTDNVNEATKKYQSIMDMIKQRDKLKAAIIHSNSTTKVKIGEVQYTVAEAIERKNSIQYLRNFLSVLREQRANVYTTVDKYNADVQRKLDRLLETSFGTERKTNVSDLENFQKSYHEKNDVVLVDPINIDKKIDELNETITTFEQNIDFVLSESNSLTKIMV